MVSHWYPDIYFWTKSSIFHVLIGHSEFFLLPIAFVLLFTGGACSPYKGWSFDENLQICSSKVTHVPLCLTFWEHTLTDMKVICLNFVCHSRLCHSFQDDFLRSQQKRERNLPEKEDLKIVFFGICPHPSLSCPFFFYFKPEFWFRFGQQITLQLHRFFFFPSVCILQNLYRTRYKQSGRLLRTETPARPLPQGTWN